MASANVREFTESNFENEVMNSEVPVLVDFWAEWCMPCRTLGPVIDAVADELGEKVKVGKVDVDSNRTLSTQFGITAIPTIIIFRKGQIAKRFLGFKKKEEIVAALNEAAA